MIFEIEGAPIAKARHRYHARGKFVATYDPQETIKKVVKAKLELQLEKAFDSPDIRHVMFATDLVHADNFRVHMEFFMPIPKSLSNKKKSLLSLQVSHTKKPDLDNLIKFYLDAANGILWEDDSKISFLTAEKFYSNEPKTVIEVIGKKIFI